ncbi:MAG: HAD family hydrolase [Candidatus Promineifilaceae bacterium]|nr:HAD family hydrolase [Candidatus Promineifilaceae bacterium]
MRLLLFDIDGTLIRSNSAGRLAMAAALEEMFGTSGPLESYNMSGKTDARIITDLMTAIGLSAEEAEQKLPLTYELMAEKAMDIYPGRGIVPCAGVEKLLNYLRSREDVVLGLLTGNSQSTTPLKLQEAGIQPEQFVVGAFGSDDLDRNRLVAVATERFLALTGRQIAGDNMVIIGDTPADILCARAGKATAIAVATGWHSMETLARYNPDFLFEDLEDLPVVTQAMLG